MISFVCVSDGSTPDGRVMGNILPESSPFEKSFAAIDETKREP